MTETLYKTTRQTFLEITKRYFDRKHIDYEVKEVDRLHTEFSFENKKFIVMHKVAFLYEGDEFKDQYFFH